MPWGSETLLYPYIYNVMIPVTHLSLVVRGMELKTSDVRGECPATVLSPAHLSLNFFKVYFLICISA